MEFNYYFEIAMSIIIGSCFIIASYLKCSVMVFIPKNLFIVYFP